MGFSLEGSASYPNDTDATKENNFLVIHGHDISEGDLNVSAGTNRSSQEGRISKSGPDNRMKREKVEEEEEEEEGGNSRRAVLVSAGTDAYTLISQSMAAVKKHLRDQLGLQSEHQESETVQINSQKDAVQDTDNKPVIEEKKNTDAADIDVEIVQFKGGSFKMGRTRALGPSFSNYFGWCTWDSFYTDLSSNRVIRGLESFKSTGVTPRFLILDDGWQVWCTG
jgi:Raffinose synthase or seed imbibition protein Sip1